MNSISLEMAQEQIARLYIDLAQDNVSAFEVFYEDITELCRRHAFEPMVNFTNKIYRFYQDDLRQYLLNEFRDWSDSSYSLDALVRNINAGSEAERTAKGVMENIGDELERMFHLNAAEIHPNTDAPNLNENDILSIQEYAEAFLRSSIEAGEQAKSDIRRIGEENNAVICLTRIVHSTADSLTEMFEAVKRQTYEGFEQFVTGMEKTKVEGTDYKHTFVSIGAGLNWPEKFV